MLLKRIKDLREDNDITQREMAKLLNTTQQYYSRYEKGEIEIPLKHFIKIAKYFNVSLDYLADKD